MSDSDTGFRLGGGGRVYADARLAEDERARRRLALAEQATMMAPPPVGFIRDAPPSWADGPETDDRRPPPDPQPEPEQPQPEQAEAKPAEQKPLTTVRPMLPDPPEPEKPPRDWQELVSTILELVGLAAVSIGLGARFGVWLGVIFAGLSCVVIGVATSRRLTG